MLNLAGKLFVGALGAFAAGKVVDHLRPKSQRSMYVDGLPIDFQQDLFRAAASNDWVGFNALLDSKGIPQDGDTRTLFWNHYNSFTH